MKPLSEKIREELQEVDKNLQHCKISRDNYIEQVKELQRQKKNLIDQNDKLYAQYVEANNHVKKLMKDYNEMNKQNNLLGIQLNSLITTSSILAEYLRDVKD